MKKRFRYTTPLLALAFMLSGKYSADGQNPNNSIDFVRISDNPDATGESLRQSGEKLAHLKAKLMEALTLKDDKIITDVKGEVKYALNEHFAHDLAIRKSALERLTKRADNAESQNKQRLASQDELIELQLQSYVIEKDALGLGSDRLDLNSQNSFDQNSGTSPDELPFGNGTSQTPSTFGDPAATPAVESYAGDLRAPGLVRGLPQNRTAMIEEARLKLARAASVEEETKATKELKDALSVYFNRDLEERNRLLTNVRADIEKMKQKLEKRASSKSSIIELQFKMFVNEASGLGFFTPPATTTTDPSSPKSFATDPFGGR